MSKLLGNSAAENVPSLLAKQTSDSAGDKRGGGGSIWSQLLNNVSSDESLQASFAPQLVNGEAGDEDLRNEDETNLSGADGTQPQSLDGTKFRSKHILIVGDSDCGKTTLLSLLRESATAEKVSLKVSHSFTHNTSSTLNINILNLVLKWYFYFSQR